MFANNLRIARKHYKLTQDELGAKLDLSHAAIASYEQGVREPNIQTLRKMSQVLHISVDDLISETDLCLDDLKTVAQPEESESFKECIALSSSHFKLLDKYLSMTAFERQKFVAELEKMSGSK